MERPRSAAHGMKGEHHSWHNNAFYCRLDSVVLKKNNKKSRVAAGNDVHMIFLCVFIC